PQFSLDGVLRRIAHVRYSLVGHLREPSNSATLSNLGCHWRRWQFPRSGFVPLQPGEPIPQTDLIKQGFSDMKKFVLHFVLMLALVTAATPSTSLSAPDDRPADA